MKRIAMAIVAVAAIVAGHMSSASGDSRVVVKKEVVGSCDQVGFTYACKCVKY